MRQSVSVMSAAIILTLMASPATPVERATVYFVPFQVDTYVPITEATIRARAWERWHISSKDTLARLLNSMTEAKGAQFDEDRVRVLVVRSDDQIYSIDCNGIGRKGATAIRINKATFLNFRDSLGPGEREILTPKTSNPE
jgi:hypothetical protein